MVRLASWEAHSGSAVVEAAERGQDWALSRNSQEDSEERGRGCGVGEEGMAWTDVSGEEATGFHDSLGGGI